MAAINLSSFAACLAGAGLKVPRTSQIMYCISPETGAPYVLYNKDQQDIVGERSAPWLNTTHHPHNTETTQHLSNQQQTNTITTPAQQITVGNQIATIHIPALHGESVTQTSAPPNPYTDHQNSYYNRHQTISADNPSGFLQLPSQVYTVSNITAPKIDKPQATTNDHSGTVQTSTGFIHLHQYLNKPDAHPPQHPNPYPIANTHTHQNSMHKQFKCGTCNKFFRQKASLIQHERIHEDIRPFLCSVDGCGKRFRQQSHLTQHSRIHLGTKPYTCPYEGCGKKFRQANTLNQHSRTHQDAASHLLYKGIGTNGTLWPQDLPYPPDGTKLENEIQPDGKELNQFSVYAKEFNHSVFGSLTDVNGKVSDVKASPVMPLYVRCPICQKEFKQKSTALQHGCIHIESRPYPCLDCGKRFRQQSHLSQHIRIHKDEKPYACIYCPRFFRQRTILNQHVRIHTNEKPYKCDLCGKDFRQKAILDSHSRTHGSQRPYCCPLSNCRRRFAGENELKKHINNHMNPAKSRKQSNTNRVGPIVKPEMFFPQAYTLPFNQAFIQQTAEQQHQTIAANH